MSRFLKFASCAAAALLVLGLVMAFGKQPEPFLAGSESAQRLQPGPLAVDAFDATFVDGSRLSPAYGKFGGLPERRLVGRVWYPADGSGAPYPLIVYSHGMMSVWEEAGGGRPSGSEVAKPRTTREDGSLEPSFFVACLLGASSSRHRKPNAECGLTHPLPRCLRQAR